MVRGLGSIPQGTQSDTAMTHLRRVLATKTRKTPILLNVEGSKEIRYHVVINTDACYECYGE